MNKHTPGPWTLDSMANYPFSIGVGPIGSDRAIAILTLDAHENREHQEANARLIAAAPEMFKALQRIEDYFDQDGYGPDAWKNLALEMAEVARAAIANAERP